MCTVKTASRHDGAGMEVLKAAARQRLAAGQDELDPGLAGAGRSRSDGGPLPIMSSRTGHPRGRPVACYDTPGSERAASRNEGFRQLVLARIIEPSTKLDSLRVLEEVGVKPPWYATVKRRLPVYAKASRR